MVFLNNMFSISHLFTYAHSDSVSMEKDNDIKLIPLETGRRLYSWFCTDAIYVPLNKHQVRSRTIFRFIFGVVFTATYVASNLSLLSNQTSLNDASDFFFALYQFNISMHAVSSFFTTFTVGPKLASVFQKLENIYNTCKGLLLFCTHFHSNSTIGLTKK